MPRLKCNPLVTSHAWTSLHWLRRNAWLPALCSCCLHGIPSVLHLCHGTRHRQMKSSVQQHSPLMDLCHSHCNVRTCFRPAFRFLQPGGQRVASCRQQLTREVKKLQAPRASQPRGSASELWLHGLHELPTQTSHLAEKPNFSRLQVQWAI